jgi:hypothetical protein
LISTGLTAHNNHNLPPATDSVVAKPTDAVVAISEVVSDDQLTCPRDIDLCEAKAIQKSFDDNRLQSVISPPRDVGKFNGYTFGLLYIFSQMTMTLTCITPTIVSILNII